MEGFGKHLKELRQAAKITQSGLAEKLNLHPQTVSKWERGWLRQSRRRKAAYPF